MLRLLTSLKFHGAEVREPELEPEFIEGSSGDVPADPPVAAPPPSLPRNLVSRSGRVRRVPRALQDYLPSSTSGLPAHILAQAPTSTNPSEPSHPLPNPLASTPPPSTPLVARAASPSPPPLADLEALATRPNHFGVYRQYYRSPRREPDDEASILQLCDDTLRAPHQPQPAGQSVRRFGRAIVQRVRSAPRPKPGSLSPARSNWFFPFLNPSAFLLMEWAHTGSNLKSNAEVQRLVDEVLMDKEFDIEELRGFKVARETARLDAIDVANETLRTVDGWRMVAITVPVPKERVKYSSEADALHFVINNVYIAPSSTL